MLYSALMKDLVEHIRSIHFTILALALVITASTQLEKTKGLERAARDAEAILRLSERWDETSANMFRSLDSQLHLEYGVSTTQYGALSDQLPIAPGPYEIFTDKQSQMSGAFAASTPETLPPELTSSGYFAVNSRWLYVSKDSSGRYAVQKPPPWKTLSDFTSFWDGVRTVERPSCP